MKICPKCGHDEGVWWRPRPNRVLASYVERETLSTVEPEVYRLTEGLRRGETVSDGHFTYKVTRGGNVEKIENELYSYMKMGQEPQERREGEPSAGGIFRK